MHVFKAMNRKEVTATILIFSLSLVLAVYGVHLVANLARGSYEPPDDYEKALLDSNTLSAPPRLSWLVLLERNFFQHCTQAHQIEYADAILFYCLATIIVISAALHIWHQCIYLPVKFICVSIDRLNEWTHVEKSLRYKPHLHHRRSCR